MKSSKLLLSLFALAAFAAAPVIRAEDTPATPPAAGAEHKEKGPRGDRLKEIVGKLDLTDDQKAKIKPIVEDAMKATKAVREDTTLDKDAKREKLMEIFKSHVDQIVPILTADQQAKLKALREKARPSKPAAQ